MNSLASALGGLALSSRPTSPPQLAARPARLRSCRAAAVVAVAAPPAAVDNAASPEAVANLRSLKGSAFKVRRVLDVIRGRDYEDTLMILEFLPQRCSEHVRPSPATRSRQP